MGAQNETIFVVGAGTMGAGIAQVAVRAGFDTTLYDTNEAALAQALERTKEDLTKLKNKEKISAAQHQAALQLLRVSTNIKDASDASLVIEAASENLVVKQTIFKNLEMHVSPSTILTTNTSTLSVGAIGSVLAQANRMMGLHFFNPATIMPLVEVIGTQHTEQAVLQRALKFVEQIGKTAIVASDTPGFVVNRIARPFYLEALRMLEQHESPEAILQIDAAMRGAGFRMGPFELLDLIGLDVSLAASQSVFDGFSQNPKYQPSPIQARMVKDGYLGKKTGRGFYEYPREKP